MVRTEVVVVGGGQAGLAMSRCLSERGIGHVVLERGRVAERWRSERWDSLTLLTPNWLTRLPGYQYDGRDPDGYMTMPEVVGFFERYAGRIGAPVQEATDVRRVSRGPEGYRVETTRGTWLAPAVVIATGYCDLPLVPQLAARLSSAVHQVVPGRYRNPTELPPGGVLVVGASASGIQLADEIRRAGREVVMAVGRHTRLPRRYRGRDILWWLDAMGVLDETADHVFDIDISRHQPALQLVGRPDHSSLDLGCLQDGGVRLVGRALAADGGRVAFGDDLIATTVAADAKLAVLRGRIDAFARAKGLDGEVGAPEPFVPLWPRVIDASAPVTLDLPAEGISTVVWATGFRRSYPWLQVPVLDDRGEIRHTRGVTPSPGLFVLGLQFQWRRKSAFIDGVGADAEHLADRIARARSSRAPVGRGAAPSPSSLPASSYDAVSVGARCAGAATALLLARQGRRVLAFDRSPYGSDTLSTHALMRGGVLQLARWGVLDRIVAAGTPPVRHSEFHYGDERVGVAIKARQGVEALYAPRRTVLDRALVDGAVAAGAEVVHGPRLVDLVRDAAGRVRGVRIEHRGGAVQEIEARTVIGADGMTSLVARLVEAPVCHAGRHATAVVYGYWAGLPVEGYHWYYGPRVGAGAIRTNEATLVFAAMPASRFADARRDLEDVYHAVIQETDAALAAALRDGQRMGPLRGFPGRPGYLRQAWGPGWALVGDASYFKDPFTAHGITDALRDAELLARAVTAGGDAAMAEYQTTRDRLSLELFHASDAIASFDWDFPTLKGLHFGISRAMNEEVAHLAELESGVAALAG